LADLLRWEGAAANAVDDPAAFAREVVPILEAWAAFDESIDSDAPLLEGQRQAAAYCSRLVADLAEFGLSPPGTTRLDALRRACEFAAPDAPFPRLERARLEADLIEELFQNGAYEEGFERVAWAADDYSDVPALLAEMLLLAANTHEFLGTYAQAFDLASRSLEILESLPEDAEPSDFVGVFASVVQAKILIHIGVVDEAARVLTQARRLAEEQQVESCEGMLLTAETELAHARGDHEWVVEHVGSALAGGDIPGDGPQGRQLRRLDLAHAAALAAMQSRSSLDESRQRLVESIEAIGIEDPTTWAPALTLCDLEWTLGLEEAARDRIHSTVASIARSAALPGLTTRSNLAAVLGRIALSEPEDREALQAALVQLEQALTDLLAAWDSVPHRPGGVGFLHFDERRSLLATLARTYGATSGPEAGALRTLEILLEVERRGSLAERMDVGDVSLERVRTALIPPGGGILAFVPSASGSVAITLDAQGGRLWDLPGADRWSEPSDRLAREMQPGKARDDGSHARLQHHAAQVRDLVLPTALDAHVSRWEEILIVRAENMGWIPFEVLPLVGRDGNALGLELATSYLPSLRVGLGLLERRSRQRVKTATAASPTVLVAVGPTTQGAAGDSGELEVIPWRDEDGRRLGAPWRRDRTSIELDAQRAVERILGAGAVDVELMIVLAHGTRDSDRERSQGFALAADQRLFAPDLGTLHAAPISVLVVCGANAGVIRRGDDLGSQLVGVFLDRGAEVVASSKTDLSFEASLALLEEFNAGLARGASPSRALHSARRRLSASRDFAHPAFHSNLTLTGLGFVPPASALRADAEDR
jgi:tetratricopeptide (TPR) repeat protein